MRITQTNTERNGSYYYTSYKSAKGKLKLKADIWEDGSGYIEVKRGKDTIHCVANGNFEDWIKDLRMEKEKLTALSDFLCAIKSARKNNKIKTKKSKPTRKPRTGFAEYRPSWNPPRKKNK